MISYCNIKPLGVFTQRSRANEGALTRGGAHQRARKRGKATRSTDVYRSVEIGNGEVPPLFADADEGTRGDEGLS